MAVRFVMVGVTSALGVHKVFSSSTSIISLGGGTDIEIPNGAATNRGIQENRNGTSCRNVHSVE